MATSEATDSYCGQADEVTGYDHRFSDRLSAVKTQLSAYLHGQTDFPAPNHSFAEETAVNAHQLWAAIRYSGLNTGKLIRPILVLSACAACGGSQAVALPTACAIELVHTQSLIHDDLPCMDDDDLRRGQPTLHKAFNESTAVLAGDALLAMAFGLIAHHTPPSPTLSAQTILDIIADFSAASSLQGLVNGQYVDIWYENQPFDGTTVDYIHDNKTGALFRFAARAGAQLAGAPTETVRTLTDYGQAVGKAFQIVDDILDIQATTERLGKTAGKDQAQKKATYPALYGVAASKAKATALIESACGALDRDSNVTADDLKYLATFILNRLH